MFHLHPDFLVRVTHCTESRSFSPLPRATSPHAAPGWSPLEASLCLGSPCISRPGSDFVPLQPRLGCTSTLHPSLLLSGWQCRDLLAVPSSLPCSTPPHCASPHPMASAMFLTRPEGAFAELTVLHPPELLLPQSIPHSRPIPLQIARRSSVCTPT